MMASVNKWKLVSNSGLQVSRVEAGCSDSIHSRGGGAVGWPVSVWGDRAHMGL